MDKKEKRIQELRSFWNHIENTETDYLKKMYEVWVENNKEKEKKIMKQLYRVYWEGCDCASDFEGEIFEDLGEAIEDLIYTIENGVCETCKGMRVSISKIYVKDNEEDYMNYDRDLEEHIYGYDKKYVIINKRKNNGL